MNEEEYNEWLTRFVSTREAKYGNKAITAGEWFGFRTTYTAITGNECPPFEKIGQPRGYKNHDKPT